MTMHAEAARLQIILILAAAPSGVQEAWKDGSPVCAIVKPDAVAWRPAESGPA